MRWMAILSACLLVVGCERPALSRKPLLGASDPPLREGVWMLGEPLEDCTVDRTSPVQTWPECAPWTIVAQGRIVRPAVFKTYPGSVPFVLAAGEPRLMQEPDRSHGGAFIYHAVRPLASDAAARVTAAETWTIVCPPRPAKGETPTVVPGVRVGRDACYVADRAALQRLVDLGPDWTSHTTMHWLRDGDR